MRQFWRFKEEHPGCVLFFRMGDFYEMFFDDAELAHRVLGVTLTQRTAGVPMAGVPYHSVEGYLQRMVQAGYRVAMCDQVGDAKTAKAAGTVVERDVTRVITPGTLTDESLLADEQTNPCAAVVFHGDGRASLAWAELSTGRFQLATVDEGQAEDELARVGPRELLYCQTADGEAPARVEKLTIRGPRTGRPGWQFRQAEAVAALRKQYGVASLAGFGLDEKDPALGAAGGLLAYLLETQRSESGVLKHLRPPRPFARAQHLVIDQASLASLEIEATLRPGETDGSLLGLFRRGGGRSGRRSGGASGGTSGGASGGASGGGCVTAMGKRRLRDWLCYPLADRGAIEARQQVVQALVDDARFGDELAGALDGVHDVPRVLARLAVGRALPRDVVALGRSAGCAAALEEALCERPTVAGFHETVAGLRETLTSIAEAIAQACRDEDVPAHLREGGLIRDGFDAELDECRGLQRDSNTWLAEYQRGLIEQTGVASLKVGYNKVFGYYIEVSAANRDKIRDEDPAFAAWTRKQTLKNAERFITPDLKTFEGKVLSAQGRAVAREQQLFGELCGACEAEIETLHGFAEVVADLDVLLCFGRRATRQRYVRPEMVDEPILTARGARHPVLGELLGDRYVPNDIGLGRGFDASADHGPATVGEDGHVEQGEAAAGGDATLGLITGPNMAGKSTYIRTAALLTLLAHTGSFVPADAATVGMCDRIFTRVGAHDELHAGRSTFMVEMTETANLCHHATERSLVILDEIGRGTSTLDGLSLAWAIAEHLAGVGCRCLFATHYHELTTLAERGIEGAGVRSGVKNLNVSVREWNDEIVFLHRIVPGATDRSYGIQVAKLAGLPAEVVARAHGLLAELTVSHAGPGGGNGGPTGGRGGSGRGAAGAAGAEPQLPLFAAAEEHPVVAALRGAELERMSPMDAFDLLRELRERAGGAS
ncbi:MAG: DNA mismatch repair protein MutS [Planctomycetota bacterium]